MRVLRQVALALVAGWLGLVATPAPRALAQEPTGVTDIAVLAQATTWPLAPTPQLVTPSWFFNEPTGQAGLPGWMAATPLRLSLQSAIFPMAGAFPNCASREDSAGNSIQGTPVRRYTLLALTPNLVLHGFSSAGCPVDGAIGGGVTYAARIRPSWWLVAGAGVYTRPAHDWLPARRAADVRVDLMKDLKGGKSVSVGLGRRGLTFGGTW